MQIEALTHFQSGYLGDGVRFVGLFQRCGKQFRFFNGLVSITRIDAGTAQKEQFLYVVTKAFANHVLLNLQVLVDEIGPVGVVGHDASHVSGSQNHIFGLFGIEEGTNSHTIHQIEFVVALTDQVGISFLKKVVPDGRTH